MDNHGDTWKRIQAWKDTILLLKPILEASSEEDGETLGGQLVFNVGLVSFLLMAAEHQTRRHSCMGNVS